MRLQPDARYTLKNEHDTPADNTDAVVTLAAVVGETHVIEDIWWSYDDDPDAGVGEVKIEAGGTEIYSVMVTTGGPGHIEMNGFHNGTANEAVVVTCVAGGAGKACTLNVQYR